MPVDHLARPDCKASRSSHCMHCMCEHRLHACSWPPSRNTKPRRPLGEPSSNSTSFKLRQRSCTPARCACGSHAAAPPAIQGCGARSNAGTPADMQRAYNCVALRLTCSHASPQPFTADDWHRLRSWRRHLPNFTFVFVLRGYVATTRRTCAELAVPAAVPALTSVCDATQVPFLGGVLHHTVLPVGRIPAVAGGEIRRSCSPLTSAA